MNYKTYWEKAMPVSDYYELVENMVSEGKTTGPNQSEALIHFTQLNQQRTNRIIKTMKPDEVVVEKLKSNQDLGFLIITESWCGDASQIVPVFSKLGELSGVEVKVVLRDENLELMDAHLTNGGRAIPIVIAVSKKDWNAKFVWGPRPSELQKLAVEHKNAPEPKPSHDEFVKELQLWYTKDKQVAIQREIGEMLG